MSDVSHREISTTPARWTITWDWRGITDLPDKLDVA
jgi:hypothetical protein